MNIQMSFESLPEFLRSTDLIKLGLYPSENALYSARIRGEGPSYIKLKRKILYPKSAVIGWIELRLKHNISPQKSNPE
jgi:hypothetical protein